MHKILLKKISFKENVKYLFFINKIYFFLKNLNKIYLFRIYN